MHEDCEPTGTGGNTTIVNQDEAEILVKATSGMPVRTEGQQEVH
ncbi:hypothetical protein ACIOHE_26355 [Streptomyces sp. NPDC087851]